MIIGIDGNEANVSNRVGSNKYAYEILRYIYEIKNEKLKIRNDNEKIKIYLKESPLQDLPKSTSWWQYIVLKPKFLWTQWRLPLQLYLDKEKPDIFFTPGHYAPRFCPMPLVISIMDLAFLKYPNQFKKNDLYQLINWTKYSVKKASHIFTISEFTKREIIHFYNYPADKITVTYPGIEEFKVQSSKFKVTTQSLKTKYKIKGDYFLYIGTLQPRKNLINLIKAFAQTLKLSNSQTLQLIICGKKGWLYDEIFELVEELGLEKKVIFTGFVSEEEKSVLFKNALAFILPSLYEGFGIPVLEAMAAGCPAIVSRSSSLTEVAGRAACYIEPPFNSQEIVKAMQKMLKLGSGEKEKLIAVGLNQLQQFAWRKTAEKTINIIQRIANN